MKQLLKIFSFLSIFFFSACGESQVNVEIRPLSNPDKVDVDEDPVFNGEGIDVSKLALAEKKFIPETSPNIYDSQNVNEVNKLIEIKAKAYSVDERFIKIIKSVAWKESRWTHYYLKKSAVYLLKGDRGASFGIFQIYTKYHPELPEIIGNTEYAIKMLWKIFKSALNQSCRSGTNRGTNEASFLRRVYATYNGGSSNMCRSGDSRDDGFVQIYQTSPWQNYL